MWLSRNGLFGAGAKRRTRGGLACAVLLGAASLTGCAAPALFVAANAANAVDGGSRGGGGSGAGERWRGYLPKAADFPGGWDVSSQEVLRVGPAGSSSPVENLKLVFGAPPQGCALPESLYKAPNHPAVTGTKAPDPNSNSGDIVANSLSTDMHAVTVEVGPAPEKDSLIEAVRGLAARCGSFQFTKNTSYDSDFQVEGSIKPADPKLGFGEAAGVVFTFAPKIGALYGSSSPSFGQDLGFTQNVYIARIKGTRVVAVSFSFKDPAADSALVLKLFQETAKRINS
ncbi:MAG: hypothetical protein ACRC20_16295 [Segniliparus sp.]|uniref:hypothetical protein n=1 Tax=Segniliparus sp. TaxID=2804064 RepID=UPI003F349FBC